MNINKRLVKIEFIFYFEDKDPIESNEIIVPDERTWHLPLDRSEEILDVKLER